MKHFLILTIGWIGFSCATPHQQKTSHKSTTDSSSTVDKGTAKVHLSFSHFIPYCGGMAPTQEMLDRRVSKQSNTTYLFLNKSEGTQVKVKTDSLGELKLDLAPGEYAIREMYKYCSFEEFKEKFYKEPSDFYRENQGGEDCYKNWWAANLVDFTITDVDSVYTYQLQTSDRCFTGNNPCIMYSGPYPP